MSLFGSEIVKCYPTGTDFLSSKFISRYDVVRVSCISRSWLV